MSKKNPFISLILFAGFLVSTPSMAMQSESPVPCDEAAEPIQFVYGDHTTGCGISPSTDLDSFNFDGVAGDVIRINLRTTGGLDGRVELFGPSGPISDTFCNAVFTSSGFIGCSVIVDVTLVETGLYGIAVSDQGSNDTGNYTLQLERIPPVPPAQPVAYNEAVSDAITPSTDMDFFAINVNAGNIIRVTVNTTGRLDGRIELWDPNGDLVVDTFCNAVFTSSGFIGCTVTTDQTLTVAGTYLLAVSDSGIDDTGNYDLTINCIFGPCPLPPTRAVCDIEMSQAVYIDGETITADVFRIVNETPASLALEIKVWLEVTGFAPIPFVNLGAEGGFGMDPGTEIDLGIVPLLQVTPGVPRGDFEFSCRFLDPITGRLLMEDRNFFEVQ